MHTTTPAGISLARVPDLDSLTLLLEIAATGSLGRAAAAHGLSQPAVTARVRSMESLVGVALVERGPRGSHLTAAGILLADWAQGVLDAASTLATGIASLRADTDAKLRVAASLTIAEHLLPHWLVQLANDLPGTAVSLDAMNSVHVEEAVLAGSVDLGFVEGPRAPAGMASRIIGHDRLAVVVPPDHPWAHRGEAVTGFELTRERLVQREPSSGTRTALEDALRAFGPLAPPVLELSTTTAVRAAAAAGAGPAVLSALAIGQDVAAGRLVEVPVEGADLRRRLRAVWPRGQRPGGPATALLRIAQSSTAAARSDRDLTSGPRPRP
ncbi:MAG: LysR family transcriptional regulator [Cellulomonadaceae bacterium]|nr:LysR family transcriptional regulator [Cellulomonadaceae bacterium]